MTIRHIPDIEQLPTTWNLNSLSQCCEIVKHQYKHSPKDIRKYIGLEHIEQQSLRLLGIGSTENISSNKFEFKQGQILFGKLRPYFRKVIRPMFDGVCSTDIWVIDTLKNNDQEFFFYFFADERIITQAHNSSKGTRMPRASWDYLEQLKFPIPPIHEQKSIAKILSDLNSKIELNQKMNKILEQIAQTVFKSWFVDYEFPNDEGKPYRSVCGEMVYSEELDKKIPKGWQIGIVNDFGKVITGKTPPTTITKYFGGPYPFITIPDMHKKIWINKSERYLSEIAKNDYGKYLLPKNSVQVSCIATVGLVSINHISSFTNQQINSIICNSKIPYTFVYCTIISINKQLIRMASGGTAAPNLNKKDFSLIQVLIPPVKLIQDFHESVKKLFQTIQNNSLQTNCLISLRDSLLPKLMSGKIRIKI